MSVTVVEPRKALKFAIAEKHCAIAKQKDPCNCVIAQAFMDKYNNKLLEVRVLQTITTLVFSGGKVERYKTPTELRAGLKEYDDTGKWDLPMGEYSLLPIDKSQTQKAQRDRADKRRKEGDQHMIRKYEFKDKIKQRPLNPRIVNLKEIRAMSATK